MEQANNFTVLFTSLSAKLALFHSVEKQVKNSFPNLNVIGVDSNPKCVAAKKISNFKYIPPIRTLGEGGLLEFCKNNGVQFIIPTRDGELPFFSKYSDLLLKNNIGVMVSRHDSIEICEDKIYFYEHLKDAPIPVIPTKSSITALPPQTNCYVVKERSGSASEHIGINLKKDLAILHASKLKDPIFQPFIDGKEFSAETWIDKSGKCYGTVLRWRLHVVQGESHESITFSNPKWEDSLERTFEKIKGLKGHILAQVLVDKNKNLHLIEINPRLGGASPLSIEAGLKSVEWSLMEHNNQSFVLSPKPQISTNLRLSKKNGIVSIY